MCQISNVFTQQGLYHVHRSQAVGPDPEQPEKELSFPCRAYSVKTSRIQVYRQMFAWEQKSGRLQF